MRIQEFTLDESCCRKANTKDDEGSKRKVTKKSGLAWFLADLVRDLRVRLLKRNIFVLNLRSVSRLFLMAVALVETSACAHGAG
jgi:hypothetical protein